MIETNLVIATILIFFGTCILLLSYFISIVNSDDTKFNLFTGLCVFIVLFIIAGYLLSDKQNLSFDLKEAETMRISEIFKPLNETTIDRENGEVIMYYEITDNIKLRVVYDTDGNFLRKEVIVKE